MKETTAQRFGFGKSFQSPSAAAAVIGAALLASGTTDEAETAWSPSAACLLPDVLPVAGTLLSYGGNRQLAAGGTVTHSGDLILSGIQKALRISPAGVETGVIYHSGGQNRLYSEGSLQPWVVEATAGFKVRNTGNTQDAAISCGDITASGNLTLTGTGNGIFLNSGGSARGIIYFSTNENRLYSASYPWVVESDQGFKVRNAANNADAALTCGAITASDNVGIGITPSRGKLHVKQAGTDYRDGFSIEESGGLDSFFSIRGDVFKWILDATYQSSGAYRDMTFRTSGVERLKIATNGAITASGAIQETPTQSSLDPTTTNIPSGKRMGWYNSTLAEFRDWVNIGGTLLKSAAYT